MKLRNLSVVLFASVTYCAVEKRTEEHDTDDCQRVESLPYRGDTMAFDSPNRNMNCDKVVISSLNSSNWTDHIPIEGENGSCVNQPEQLITFPGNITGAIKLSWSCSGDKKDPCRILTIKSETRPGAASTATAFAVRQTCPSSLPTEMSSDASTPTINQSAAPLQSTGDPTIDMSSTQAGSTAPVDMGPSVPTTGSSQADGSSNAPIPSADPTTEVPSTSMARSISVASSTFTTSISPATTTQPIATNNGIDSSDANGSVLEPTTQATALDTTDKPGSSVVNSSGQPCTCAGQT